MKNLLRTSLMTALVAGLMVFAAAAANANPVTFSTTASFNGGAFSSPNAIVFGGMGNQLSLTFTGVTNSAVDTGPAGFTFATMPAKPTGRIRLSWLRSDTARAGDPYTS